MGCDNQMNCICCVNHLKTECPLVRGLEFSASWLGIKNGGLNCLRYVEKVISVKEYKRKTNRDWPDYAAVYILESLDKLKIVFSHGSAKEANELLKRLKRKEHELFVALTLPPDRWISKGAE
jgi:hypothetical protein